MEVDGTFNNLTKKEISLMLKERSRLERNLGGIKEMKEVPGVVLIIDTRNESIAVDEARAVGVPIVAVVDTNCNPEGIDYPIPGNDDAIRAINLFTQIIANAVVEAENEVGLEVIENLHDDEIAEEYASYPELSDSGRGEGEQAGGDQIETVALGDALQAEDDDKKHWMDETIDYIGERYPDLTDGDLTGLREMGIRFCQPAIAHGVGSASKKLDDATVA